MKKIFFILSLIAISSCGPEIQLEELNGYWEIDHVMFANATKKKYAMNTTVDYFQYQNDKGFVKKVQPQLDGSFKTSNDSQLFTVEITEEGVFLNFENGIREKISRLNNKQLIIQTLDSTSFHYKAFEPLSMTPNE